MSGMENGVNTVTLRVNRFAPRAERARDRAAARAASSGCRITR